MEMTSLLLRGNDRSRLSKVKVGQRVDGGVVRGEPDGLGVGIVVGYDEVVEISAEVAFGPDADGLERNRRIGPQVRLHGALIVDLVKHFARRLFGGIALLELEIADASLNAVGRLGACACDGQRSSERGGNEYRQV